MFDEISKDLESRLTEGAERGGIVLRDGTVIEFANISSDPAEGYQPNPEELLPHLNDLVATWHTHPGETANLSVEDWETFTAWPDLHHAIVGTDGVRWYAVKNGAVVNA